MSGNFFEWDREKTESGKEFLFGGYELTSELKSNNISEFMLINFPINLIESDIETLIRRIHYLEAELEILNRKYNEVTQKKTEEQERYFQEEIESIKKPTETINEENIINYLSKTNKKLVEKIIELTEDYKNLVKEHQLLEKDTNKKISALEERINNLIESKLSVSSAPSRWIDDIVKDLEEEEKID